MYPLSQNIPNRANDYGLDIRGDQGVPPENQASTSCGHVDVVQIENQEADMMPLGKREGHKMVPALEERERERG